MREKNDEQGKQGHSHSRFTVKRLPGNASTWRLGQQAGTETVGPLPCEGASFLSHRKLINAFKPEITIVIFIHNKSPIAVAILNL